MKLSYKKRLNIRVFFFNVCHISLKKQILKELDCKLLRRNKERKGRRIYEVKEEKKKGEANKCEPTGLINLPPTISVATVYTHLDLCSLVSLPCVLIQFGFEIKLEISNQLLLYFFEKSNRNPRKIQKWNSSLYDVLIVK